MVGHPIMGERGAVTGIEFRAALEHLGMTQRAFAARFGLLEGSVSRWVIGDRQVPSWVPSALELLQQEGRDGMEA